MKNLSLFYATNRQHPGEIVRPAGYVTSFSADSMENLRFGRVILKVDDGRVNECLTKNRTCGEARGSSGAFGRGLLKLRDFLREVC